MGPNMTERDLVIKLKADIEILRSALSLVVDGMPFTEPYQRLTALIVCQKALDETAPFDGGPT